jgi:thiamine kinase-like enzyme
MRLKNILFIGIILLQSVYAIAQYPVTLEPILHQLPEWEKFGKEAKIEKIEAGLTNQNFKVIFPFNAYFIRMGSQNADLLGLDSDREYFCTKEAAALGITPPVLFYFPDSHAMVMPFIESKPIEKSRTTYEQIFSSLHQFHNSGMILSNVFCPYGVIRDYYRNAVHLRSDHHVPLSAYLLSIVEEIRKVAPSYRQLAPCHLDLYSKNFLDDGNKVWIIDWEYSAMADPLYDLATLASADFLSWQEMQEILQIYLEKPTPQDFAYFYLMTILVDVRWAFWSLIQAEASPIKAPYLDYADYFFQQIIQRVNHPQYQKSLSLLQPVEKQE